MRRSLILASVLAAAVAALGSCSNTPEVKPPATPTASPIQSASPVASPAVSPAADDKKVSKVDSWAGKWQGPEGTYLDITKKGEKFSIEVRNLDKAETFEGTAKGDTIEFMRKGKTETIKAATGEETGMKWLAGEKNCLVINKGSEGFCKK